jgi:hypothetical protein
VRGCSLGCAARPSAPPLLGYGGLAGAAAASVCAGWGLPLPLPLLGLFLFLFLPVVDDGSGGWGAPAPAVLDLFRFSFYVVYGERGAVSIGSPDVQGMGMGMRSPCEYFL